MQKFEGKKILSKEKKHFTKNIIYYIIYVVKINRSKNMTKEEALEECRELIENGAGKVEVFEWIEDNTDLDPAELWEELY